MTTGFSTAATWLQNVSGADPNAVEPKDEHKDPVLRDLRAMQDAERIDGAHQLPPPRHDSRGGRNAAHTGGAHLQQQPKPKFVAHKAPTSGKKGKAPAESNRLGGHHMAFS
ncbi:hypothetical protein ACHAXT_004870 [Thalassiosira profunda]